MAVHVMRGANCWTDHQLVRARLTLRILHMGGGRAQSRRPFSIYKLALPAEKNVYVKCLEEALQTHLSRSDFCSEYNWKKLRC